MFFLKNEKVKATTTNIMYVAVTPPPLPQGLLVKAGSEGKG